MTLPNPLALTWPAFKHQGRSLAPGLMLCVVIGMAAAFIEMRWGGPRVLYALLMGMAFHELSGTTRHGAGVSFSAQTLLRLGIGLLGARITLHQMASLGWPTVALILAAVASTIVCVALVVKGLGMPWRIGLIAGGATAICGASAALAIAAVVPRDRLTEQRTLAIVVCATTLSTMAMLGYPLLCHWLALRPDQSGLMLGGSIHDVAQVMVAGYTMGRDVGDIAIIVKLLRVSLLAVVVLSVSALLRWHQAAQPSQATSPHHGTMSATPSWVPWFMQLFIGLAVLQSMQWLAPAISRMLSDLSQSCLAVSAAALGMRSSIGMLRQAGWRIMMPMLMGAVWLAAVVLCGGLLMPSR
jgi:uncharacterized integral membrane protein (TIGR00698 family)